MAHGIGPVCREAYFQHRIAFHVEKRGYGATRYCILRQHHDPLMPLAQPHLILGAQHALRHLAAYFPLFNPKALPISRIEGYPHLGHHRELARRHVWRTAHYAQRLAAAHIHCGYV